MSAFLRKYATSTHLYLPMILRGVVDFALGADWTPATGDVRISIDGGASANVATLPVAVAMGNTAMWDFALSSGEMTGRKVIVTVADAATKVVEDQAFVVETYGHASAEYPTDYSADQTPLKPTVAGRTLDVSTGGEGGVDWANVGSPTTAVALSGTTVGTVSALASDSITAAVIAAGAIDADAIAADAIGGSELAASAVSKIQVGLALGVDLANVAASLATVATYVDTEVASILAAVDTEVAAIKLKTDTLPASFPVVDGSGFVTLAPAGLDEVIVYIDMASARTLNPRQALSAVIVGLGVTTGNTTASVTAAGPAVAVAGTPGWSFTLDDSGNHLVATFTPPA